MLVEKKHGHDFEHILKVWHFELLSSFETKGQSSHPGLFNFVHMDTDPSKDPILSRPLM